MLDDGNVQGNTTKDFVEGVDRFMASLTESLSYSKGKTLLYVPPIKLACDHQAKDKYMTQRLESIVIRWTRQVKEVCPSLTIHLLLVRNQLMFCSSLLDWIICLAKVVRGKDRMMDMDVSGPLEEIEFWRQRSLDLDGIHKQINQPVSLESQNVD
jgi:dynein heavy chain